MKKTKFHTIAFILFSIIMGGGVGFVLLLSYKDGTPITLLLVLLPVILWLSEYVRYKKLKVKIKVDCKKCKFWTDERIGTKDDYAGNLGQVIGLCISKRMIKNHNYSTPSTKGITIQKDFGAIATCKYFNQRQR